MPRAAPRARKRLRSELGSREIDRAPHTTDLIHLSRVDAEGRDRPDFVSLLAQPLAPDLLLARRLLAAEAGLGVLLACRLLTVYRPTSITITSSRVRRRVSLGDRANATAAPQRRHRDRSRDRPAQRHRSSRRTPSNCEKGESYFGVAIYIRAYTRTRERFRTVARANESRRH